MKSIYKKPKGIYKKPITNFMLNDTELFPPGIGNNTEMLTLIAGCNIVLP